MTQLKLIEGAITPNGQAVTFKYLCRYGDHKLRFTIKSDAYKAQCFGRAEIWSPAELKWNQVAGLSPAQLETPNGLVYRPNHEGLDERHFIDDYDHLIRLVKAIID